MQSEVSCFLIDNDVDDQEIFSMALQEIDNSISCIVANDGISAIQKLTSTATFLPSFIFIDMNMPLMDGKECLQEIRKINRLADVPVYIYSTAANPHDIEEAKKLGAKDFITKPPGFSQLVELLSSVLHPGKTIL